MILAERREVLAAVPAACPERDQALDELRGRQPALPLLARDVGLDRCRDPELAEQFDHQRDPGAAGERGNMRDLRRLRRGTRRMN